MKKLVTGRAAFVDDLVHVGVLHLGLVTSPHPHARITAVDSAAARSLPGVVDVITHLDDIRPAPEADRPRAASVLTAVTRFVGAPAAIVVAEDPEIAGRAVEAVRVSYEPLPPVRWPEAEAPLTASLAQVIVASGDLERAFGEADRVVTVAERLARTHVNPLEPPVALAWLDEDGQLVVRSATSSPLRLRRALADALGVAGGRIRIERPEVGGDFGARGGSSLEAACALVALRTGRPARLSLRPDHPLGGFERSACVVTASAAVRAGVVRGIDVRLLQEVGAAPANGDLETELRRAAATLVTYAFPASRFEALARATNAPPGSGSAALATCVALEALLDEAADAVGEDPLSFRARHLTTAARDAGLDASLDRCAREAGFPRRLKATTSNASRRGLGLALARSTLAGADATATVSRNEDGSFTVAWSPCETSTSARPLLEALLARTLGVSPESVTANLSAPAEPPASGVADLWLTAEAALAAGAEMAATGIGAGTRSGSSLSSATRKADDAPAPTGAFAAEVDVDPETGVVTLLRLVQAQAGGSAEPLVVAKAEGDGLRGAGVVLFGSASGVGPGRLRSVDLPRLSTLLASDRGPSPLGAVPVGDVAFLGAAAAIANAVARAIGTRVLDLPLHPAAVLAALEGGGS